MEIHKPKPWHGWREFLKEYLIIVVGVLTALTAEAGVEWLHWRHLAAQNDEELRAGAEGAAFNAIQRLAVDGCLREALRDVSEALQQPGVDWKGLNPHPTGSIDTYLPPTLSSPARPWPYAAWERALGDGSLTHLPRDRVRSYSVIFRTAHDVVEQQQILGHTLPELAPLAFSQKLTSQEKAHYLGIIAQADQVESLMAGMSRTVLRTAVHGGIWPSDASVKPLISAMRARRGACVKDVRPDEFREDAAVLGPKAMY